MNLLTDGNNENSDLINYDNNSIKVHLINISPEKLNKKLFHKEYNFQYFNQGPVFYISAEDYNELRRIIKYIKSVDNRALFV